MPIAEFPADPLNAALLYASLGIRVMPVRGRRPCINSWQNRATTDEARIRSWWQEFPNANVGVLCGAASGIVVVDVDPRNGGDDHLASVWKKLGIKEPSPLVVQTASGGRHFYFRHPGTLVRSRTGKNGIAPGIEIKADAADGSPGQMVVAPPSKAPSKVDNSEATYLWLANCDVSEFTKLLDANPFPVVTGEPQVRAKKAGGKKKGSHDDLPPAEIEPIISGCAWMRHCRDDARDLSEPEWYAMLSILGRCYEGEKAAHQFSAPHPGYDREITQQKYEQAIQASGPRTCEYIAEHFSSVCADCSFGKRTKMRSSPILLGTTFGEADGRFNWTDAGNADRFAAQHRQRICYCPETGKWLFFQKHRWTTDETGQIYAHIIRTIRAFAQESLDAAKFAMKQESKERINAIEVLSRHMLAVSQNRFDQHKDRLVTPAGVVNLRTGMVVEGDPADYLSKSTTVEFKPGARDETWERFLDEATGGDSELREYLQRCAGYSITGSVREEKFFIVYGRAGTGKSTFINAVASVAGEYATTADVETFIRKENPGIRNDLARLVNRRLVITHEIERGKHLAEALVKQITGGDPITARFLHREYFEFVPQLKLWMVTNDLPLVRAGDSGIWRRAVVIPFDQVPARVNENLKNELATQKAKEAILAWLVEGAMLWQRDGLAPPRRILEAVEMYRRSVDPIASWLSECCSITKGHRAPVTLVRRSYEEWCRENSEDPIGQYSFNTMLEERGCFRRTARVQGEVYKVWENLRLLDEAEVTVRAEQQKRLRNIQ